MRINRYLARCGISSRRKAEELILSGKVYVNGTTIRDLATNIDPVNDQVCVDNKKLFLPTKSYFALNKPSGYTVTKKDQHAQKTVFELLPDIPGLVSVGRLDRDSCGLLILTNDGDFSQSLIHPSKSIEKEYFLKTKKPLTDLVIEKIREGVMLEDGFVKPVSVSKQDGGLKIIITQGKNRQIRRMIKSVGGEVSFLQRVRIGIIRLEGKEGSYRKLNKKEIQAYANVS